MDDLLFSLNTVFPLLVMMAVGFTARRVGVIGESAARQINACVFKIFLPLLLCFNIVDTQLGASTDVRTLLYAFITTLLCFGVLFAVTPRLCRDRASCGVLIQGIARSNYAIFGIPLVMMMYPEGDTSIAVLMVAVVVPVFNVLSTVALMVFAGEKGSPWRIVKGVLLNPLILGTLAGFLLWYFRIPIPSLLETPLRSLGSIATPLALFVLGAGHPRCVAGRTHRRVCLAHVGFQLSHGAADGWKRRSCGRTGGLYHGLFHSDRVFVGICAQEPGLSGIKRARPGFFRYFFAPLPRALVVFKARYAIIKTV